MKASAQKWEIWILEDVILRIMSQVKKEIIFRGCFRCILFFSIYFYYVTIWPGFSGVSTRF